MTPDKSEKSVTMVPVTPDKSEKSVTMVPVTPEKSVLYTVPVWHLRNLYALFFYFVHQPHYKEPLIMNMEYYTTLYLPSTVTIDKFNEHDSSQYAEILPQQWKAVAWVSRPIPIPAIEWVGLRTRAFTINGHSIVGHFLWVQNFENTTRDHMTTSPTTQIMAHQLSPPTQHSLQPSKLPFTVKRSLAWRQW